jgi:hypothetical protein
LFPIDYKRLISPCSGFQDRLFRPLTHPSAAKKSLPMGGGLKQRNRVNSSRNTVIARGRGRPRHTVTLSRSGTPGSCWLRRF